MPQQATKSEKHTLIEQGTEFKGTLTSTCPVVVNGRVEGELRAPELDITATGSVQGNVKAERLSSRGKLSGNIDAGDLYLSGSVGSKTVIKAKNLEVRLSPEQGRMELTIGECTLDVGDEPSKERRVEPSLRPQAALNASLSQLPVTKSSPPPAPAANDEKPETTALVVTVPEEKIEAKDSKAEAKDTGDGKSTKGAAYSLSKPPQSRKPGARDSVPPGK